jgi:glycosyltransferase involved in cell wall biosynthesis
MLRMSTGPAFSGERSRPGLPIHSVFIAEIARLSSGPSGQVLRLAKAWAALGYPTAIASLRGDLPPTERDLRSVPVPVYQLTHSGKDILKSFRLDAAWAIRKWIHQLRPTLIFSMETLVDYHVKVGLLGTDRKTVTLIASDRWYWERHWYRVALMRALAHKSAAVIGNSQATVDAYARVLGRSLSHIPQAVLHNAVDPDQFPPRPEPKPSPVLTIGGLGRFTDQKGFDLLLDAFARLPETIAGRPVRLRIQGHGPLQAELEALTLRLGIGSRVEFVPFSADVQTFLSSLDCLVVPSRYAGMENVALEGMLCGTPTLCSTASGLQELPPEPCLRLIDLQPESVSAQIAEVLGMEPGERRALGAAQRRFIMQHLSLNAVATRLEDLLRGAGLARATRARNDAPTARRQREGEHACGN